MLSQVSRVLVTGLAVKDKKTKEKGPKIVDIFLLNNTTERVYATTLTYFPTQTTALTYLNLNLKNKFEH